MNKEDIKTKLTEMGVQFPPSANKPELEDLLKQAEAKAEPTSEEPASEEPKADNQETVKPADSAPTPPVPSSPTPPAAKQEKLVTVVCAVPAMFEGETRYVKGEQFEVTEERAKALGKRVTLSN